MTATFPKRLIGKGATGETRYFTAINETGALTWCTTAASFLASPTTFAVEMEEHPIMKGVYSGTVTAFWERGKYLLCQYKQEDVAPLPAADTLEAIYLVSVSEGFITSVVKLQ